MSYPFELKKVYNFDVYPSTILGDDFRNVTILSIMDYESALQLADVAAIHVNVYPYLPAGLPDDPSQYDYVRIRTASGQSTILGISWINLDTVELVESRRMTIKIDGVGSSDIERVRLALVQNGYNNIEISIS